MAGHQHATIGDTVYFWFAANNTSGSGGDGATPLYDVREAGAAASAIPLLSGTPTLLTHANFPAGCHEIAVEATVGNGFAADDTFGVFCTIAVDSQNPSGFVGSCTLTPLAKTAALDDVPTVSEFNARTILAANYFDPANDDVAVVTALSATGLDAIDQTSLAFIEIAKAIADRVITKALHDIPNSLAKIIRQLRDRSIASDGMAQAGGNNTITLAAGSSAIDDFFKECYISLIGGTGAGQSRLIITSNGTTKVATVHRNWLVNPDNTTEYITSANAVSSLAMINNDNQSMLDFKDFVDAGYDPATNKVEGVKVADSLTALGNNAITAAAIATDAFGALELATDAVQEIVDGIRQQVLTEGYAADAAAPTMEQILFMIWSDLSEFAYVGTTKTSRRLDGSTTSMTHTLDDATDPTSKTRAT